MSVTQPMIYLRVAARVVPEGGANKLVAAVRDGDTALTPTSVRWRVDDADSESQALGWTSATPATSMTLAVPGTANTVALRNLVERKVVTVEATVSGAAYRATTTYDVRASLDE